MHRFLRTGVFLLFGATVGAAQSITTDAQEIVRSAFEADQRNQELAAQYAYREHAEERKLDSDGEIKATESKTYDVAHLCGRYYQRLIARDDQPLSAGEDQKEQQKLDKCIEKLQSESSSERSKRLKKEEEAREEQRRLRREVLNALSFTVNGEDSIEGQATWRIRAEPIPDYEPEFRKAAFLSKLSGVIWIAKRDYGWVKTEVETIEPAKFGLFLLTLKKGAEMEFTQTKVNDELWLMNHFRLRFDARVLVRGLRREVLVDWSDFKKFTSDSRLITGELE